MRNIFSVNTFISSRHWMVCVWMFPMSRVWKILVLCIYQERRLRSSQSYCHGILVYIWMGLTSKSHSVTLGNIPFSFHVSFPWTSIFHVLIARCSSSEWGRTYLTRETMDYSLLIVSPRSNESFWMRETIEISVFKSLNSIHSLLQHLDLHSNIEKEGDFGDEIDESHVVRRVFYIEKPQNFVRNQSSLKELLQKIERFWKWCSRDWEFCEIAELHSNELRVLRRLTSLLRELHSYQMKTIEVSHQYAYLNFGCG